MLDCDISNEPVRKCVPMLVHRRSINATLEDAAFTCILQKTLALRGLCGGGLARRIGIGGTALGVLLMLYVPGHPVLAPDDYAQEDEGEEQAWVRDLLLAHAEPGCEASRVLAFLIARRSMEGGHLWEDLGLPDRTMLTSIMRQFFPDLAARNVDNMRWKRFFFRQLCEADGLSHCTSPTCCTCPDVELCFEPGSTEALLARNKTAPGLRC